jgi:hypothetical protein
MKKFFILLVVLLGFSSFASAQEFGIKAGVAYNFGLGIGANLGVTTPNLVKFSSDLGLGVRADFKSDFSAGLTGILTLSSVVNFSLGGKDYLYFGPTAGLALAGGSAAFIFGLDVGDVMYLSKELAWYADAKVLLVPAFLVFADLGVSYSLSKQLALYFEFQGATTGGNGFGFGIGLGAKLKL